MDGNLIGQFAAIITSMLWTADSIFFTSAGKRIGAISVNAYRIIIAVILLSIIHLIIFGSIIPIVSNEQIFFIGLSGIIGLGVGDFGFFSAIVIIGPRRALVIMALSPLFAAVSAYFLIGEILSNFAITGIFLTLIGIVVVIMEEEEKSFEGKILRKEKIWGISLALLGAIGQGIGSSFAKKGITIDPTNTVNSLSTTLIRMTFAFVFIWICTIIAGKSPELIKAIKDKKGISYTLYGAVLGSFLGVTFSMIAVTFTEVGIAQTLISLMPVMIIPVLWIGNKQKTSFRGIIGALIAIVGVAILFIIK